MSRITPKTPKLIFKFGKLHSEWDFIAAGGPGTYSADRNLLLYMFTCSHPRYDHMGKMTMEKSFLDELEGRGYDTKTIKFSIEKKST